MPSSQARAKASSAAFAPRALALAAAVTIAFYAVAGLAEPR